MKKMVFLLGMLGLIMNSYAKTVSPIAVALSNTTKIHITNRESPVTMIYGGQDLSHSQIAVANEKVETGEELRKWVV